MIHLHDLLLMMVLLILNQSGHAHLVRPQYFALGYIQWIEIINEFICVYSDPWTAIPVIITCREQSMLWQLEAQTIIVKALFTCEHNL